MNLPNSVSFQVNVHTDAIDRFYNVKVHVVKSSGEPIILRLPGIQRGIHWRISIQSHII